MRHALLVGLPLLVLTMAGCRSHYAQIHTFSANGGNGIAINKAERIAVEPLSAESIRERQFITDIREQLCRLGYTHIVQPDQAPRWMLRYKVETHMDTVGYSTQIRPGWLGYNAATTPERDEMVWASFKLFNEREAGPIWEGDMETTGHLFEFYHPVSFMPVLEQLGRQTSGEARFNREEARRAESEAKPCLH